MLIKMPLVSPLPIETKGLPFLKAVWVWLTEPRKWILIEDFRYYLPTGELACVPKGYTLDFVSVPWFIRPLVKVTGLMLVPSIFHDFAYDYGYIYVKNEGGYYEKHKLGANRAYWDKLFRDIGSDVNGFDFLNYPSWLFLAAFGWMAWVKCRSRKINQIFFT